MDRASDYALFSKLYRGRDDRVGLWREDAYYPLAGGFTFERFCEHLDLREKYALYAADDLGRVWFGLFDFDVLPRDQGWESLLPRLAGEKEKVLRLMGHLRAIGVPDEAMVVEFPTVGYHLLLSFAEPLLSRSVKASCAPPWRRSAATTPPPTLRKSIPQGLGTESNSPFESTRTPGAGRTWCEIWRRSTRRTTTEPQIFHLWPACAPSPRPLS